MLDLHPIIRLTSALLLVGAIFLTKSMSGIVGCYLLVIILIMYSQVIKKHLRFVFYVSLPMLLALLIMWGWIVDIHKVPEPFTNGVTYAFFAWLRIISWGGVLQFVFIPLVEKPAYLRSFFDKTRLNGKFGILIIASIVFLPEMQRRLYQIIDARHAQGKQLSGLKGLIDLPTILMPLISSLLDSASKRAELWSHRGVLETGKGVRQDIVYSDTLSTILFLSTLVLCTVLVLA